MGEAERGTLNAGNARSCSWVKSGISLTVVFVFGSVNVDILLILVDLKGDGVSIMFLCRRRLRENM